MSTDTNAERAKALGELIKAGAWNMQSGWPTLCERVDALVAIASHPLPPVEGWQPIETAPMDGTLIVGYWSSAECDGKTTDTCYALTRFDSGSWGAPDADDPYMEPDWWQPLPTAPTLPQEKT